MQIIWMMFLAFLLAHVLGDFLLQPQSMAKGKAKSVRYLLWHGFIHYTLLWICITIFADAAFFSIRAQFIAIAYIATHLLIDYFRCKWIARNTVRDSLILFVADQSVHIVILLSAAIVLTRTNIIEIIKGAHISQPQKAQILETAIIYVSVVFGVGYLIRHITRGLSKDIRTENTAQLGNAGLYIGWIERFLIITAMAMQSPALVGLILTGKSIARYPEFKEAKFAEYFLIGTLLSVSFSVLGGILLLRILYGTVSLK